MPFTLRISSRTALLTVCLPLALLLISPIFHIAMRAAEIEPQEAIGYLRRPGTQTILLNSLLLLVTVSVSSCAIAIPAAWLTARTDLYARKFWSVVLMLPLVIPSFIGAFALLGAIGQKGFVQDWLGVERLPSILGFWGSWLTITLFTYPYVYISTRAGLRGIDPALEEASRTLGRSSLYTFRHVTLPQLRPFISAGTLLVSLYTLSEFGAVSVMQYDVFSRAIFFQLNFDRSLAALLSLILVIFTIAILLLAGLMEGRGKYYTRGVRRQAAPMRLGRWQLAAQIFCITIALMALVAPLGVIAYWLVNGLQHGETLNDLIGPLHRSLRVAGMAAIASGIVALPFVFLQVRFPGASSQIIARSAYLGYAIPGVVIGLALTFFGARFLLEIKFLGLDNYRIIPVLIFAYLVRFLPQALGPSRAGLMQVNPGAEESGVTLGRSRPYVFATVTLPLMRSGWVAGMALVFLTTMKELPATLMLAPAGYDTLSTRIWSATGEAFYARGAAPALTLVIFSALTMAFILEADND
jgi:iron(III) transport system permease protein